MGWGEHSWLQFGCRFLSNTAFLGPKHLAFRGWRFFMHVEFGQIPAPSLVCRGRNRLWMGLSPAAPERIGKDHRHRRGVSGGDGPACRLWTEFCCEVGAAIAPILARWV